MRGSTVKTASWAAPEMPEMTKRRIRTRRSARRRRPWLRATANPTQAGDWALVLAAAGIGYRLEERDGRFVLAVAAGDAPAAAAALAAFDAEAPAKPVPPAPDAGASALGVLSALGLGAMYYVAGPGDAHSRWVRGGGGRRRTDRRRPVVAGAHGAHACTPTSCTWQGTSSPA